MPDKDLISKQLLQRLLIGFGTRLFDLDIVEAELLSNEQARIESRRADLVARVKEADGKSYILHVEIQNDNRNDMPLRMLRYYSDIALAHPSEKIIQYLLYIGKAPLHMSDRVRGDNWRYRYRVLDMRDQDSEYFLKSGNPDALVLAILCDPKRLEPNALVAHIIKELRRLHGDKLDNLRDSLKMLDVLSGNRGLQDVVKESAEMYIDPEKLGIYQAVKERSEARGIKKGEARGEARGIKKGEARGEARGIKKGEAQGIKKGEARGLKKMVLKLLAKLPPEQVAELTGMSQAEVQAIAATKSP